MQTTSYGRYAVVRVRGGYRVMLAICTPARYVEYPASKRFRKYVDAHRRATTLRALYADRVAA